MTEQEWLDCTDPEPILRAGRGKLSKRKLHLFAVACCRRLWSLIADTEARAALECVERYADGLAGEEELARASGAATRVATAANHALTHVEAAERRAPHLVALAVFSAVWLTGNSRPRRSFQAAHAANAMAYAAAGGHLPGHSAWHAARADEQRQ
jgi:hypothetical protein